MVNEINALDAPEFHACSQPGSRHEIGDLAAAKPDEQNQKSSLSLTTP